MPAQARQACPYNDPNTDGHLTVFDQASGWEYDFWRAQINNSTRVVSAQGMGRSRSDGLGIWNSTDDGGSEAANFGLAAGNLRAQEVQAGTVNHALFLTMPCVNGTVYPAHGGAAQCPSSAGNPGLHLGTHLFLEMSQSQIQNLSVPAWQKPILQALRAYGGYVGDTGGGGQWGLKPEGSETYSSFGAAIPWDTYGRQLGLPQFNGHSVWNMVNTIDWHRLRVAPP
jgi:hypothetical protein